MNRSTGRGFVLVGVLMLLIGLVAIALTMTETVTIDHHLVELRYDKQQLGYVAEAGLEHASWALGENESCDNYEAVGPVNFGDHTYSVRISPVSGTPVSLAATATMPDGMSTTLTRADVGVYGAPLVQQFKMGPGDKSAHIEGKEDKQDHNHSGKPNQTLSGDPDDEIRPLFTLNLDELPAAIKVIEATLTLHITGRAGGSLSVGVHRITGDWREDEVTWIDDTGASIFGRWGSAGGDFDATPGGRFSIDDEGSYDIDVTNLVQAWSDRATNHGFLLLAERDSPGKKYDISTGQENDEALHPRLSVTYSCLCGQDCSAGTSATDIFVTSFDDVIELDGTQYEAGDAVNIDVAGATGSAKLLADDSFASDSNIAGIHFDGDTTAYFAVDGFTTIGGDLFNSGDVVRYDIATDTATRVVDRNDFFLANGVNGIHIRSDGTVLLSTVSGGFFNGLYVYPDDVIEFNPTTGSVTRLIDGSTLFATGIANIDALHEFPSGRLALSFDVTSTVLGVSVERDDLLLYDPSGPSASVLFVNTLVSAERASDLSNLDGVHFSIDSDPEPGEVMAGSGYVAEPSAGCPAIYRDDFDSTSFSLNNGTVNFTTGWLEIGESNGGASGDIRVVTDNGLSRLRIRDADNGGEGVQREMDLTIASEATLSLMTRRANLDDSDDFVALSVSDDGGSNWTELDRYAGPDNDEDYVVHSYDLTPYRSATTRIRFLSSSDNGGTDTVYIDNVRVAVGGCP
ncbi:MAG: DNRLRE domain-containing protein [Gammaproteobacteria bacterium]